MSIAHGNGWLAEKCRTVRSLLHPARAGFTNIPRASSVTLGMRRSVHRRQQPASTGSLSFQLAAGHLLIY